MVERDTVQVEQRIEKRYGTVQLQAGRNIERRLAERSTERLRHGGSIARRLVELSIVRLQAGRNTEKRLVERGIVRHRLMGGKRIALLLFDQHTERLLKINNIKFYYQIFLLYNLILPATSGACASSNPSP